MIASKKFESRILSVAPVGMILLLKYSAEDYLAPMYDWSSGGPLIMTVCLHPYFFLLVWATNYGY